MQRIYRGGMSGNKISLEHNSQVISRLPRQWNIRHVRALIQHVMCDIHQGSSSSYVNLRPHGRSASMDNGSLFYLSFLVCSQEASEYIIKSESLKSFRCQTNAIIQKVQAHHIPTYWSWLL